jgi:hypothetical protein
LSVGRNDPCPCGSGRKFKQCCLKRQQASEQAQHRLGITPVGAPAAGEIGVWQVDLTPVPVLIEDRALARPAALLIVESAQLLDSDLLATPPSEPTEIAAELQRRIQSLAERIGSWPERVVVRDADVAEALRAHMAARHIEVEHRSQLDGLDELAADLRQNLAQTSLPTPPVAAPETWRGWGLPTEVIAEVFRAAAHFHRARPWKWVVGDDPILAVEGTSRPWVCSVLGNAGAEFGLGLSASEEDFVRLFEGTDAFPNLSGPLLSLTFEPATEISVRMRREITAAGWEVAGPDAYPMLIAVNTPAGGMSRAMAEDLARLLRAIPSFVEEHQDLLEPGFPPEEPLEWRDPDTGLHLRMEAGPGAGLAVETPWDAPEFLERCLPEGPNADPEAVLSLTLLDAGSVDALRDAEWPVIDRFADVLAREGLAEATLRRHVDNVSTFVESMVGYQGVPLRSITEFDLRSFLFDLYPRKVRDAEHRAEAMPASLKRFFHFLAEHEGIRCPWADAVLAEREEYSERRATFPGGHWWDQDVVDWQGELGADLINRGLLHWPAHADGSSWGPEMGIVEADLEREVQRRWLHWRDQAIDQGATDPGEVRHFAIERQLEWEETPHPRLDGRTPLEAIQQERAARGADVGADG